jgi:hypothetical protein
LNVQSAVVLYLEDTPDAGGQVFAEAVEPRDGVFVVGLERG